MSRVSIFPDGSRVFSDISFVDREFSPLRAEGKECRLDIVGVLDDGEQINVEVQVLDRGDYEKRSVFYWSIVHCGQLERWMAYLAGQEGTTMEHIAEKEPMIGEALDMERMFLMDKMERLAYIQSWKQMMDEANREETVRRFAEAKGMEIGEARGKAQGAKENSLNVARNLLGMGLAIDKISLATGLDEEEIRSLSE